MTHLRKAAVEEILRRNHTDLPRVRIRIPSKISRYFKRQPDKIGPERTHDTCRDLFNFRKLA
jgi:hypothetical protein